MSDVEDDDSHVENLGAVAAEVASQQDADGLPNAVDVGVDVLDEVMRRQLDPGASPTPVAADTTLPMGPPMDPLIFERLVAEIAQTVFNLDEVHAYGRQGQAQFGLDIVGWKGDKQIVYQVRRIEKLTPTRLEKAVQEYAAPSRKIKKEIVPIARPFPVAAEFVLVTACMNDDTAVTDRLNELKTKYEGDFVPRLLDARQLSVQLRHYGAIVSAYFGKTWAEHHCHYTKDVSPGIGDGAGLLDDPFAIIGKRESFDKATHIADGGPRAAAVVYDGISDVLRKRSLPLPDVLYDEATRLLAKAGDLETAFDRTVGRCIIEIEKCSASPELLQDATRVAAELGTTHAQLMVDLLGRASQWFRHGYETSDVTPQLRELGQFQVAHIAKLGLIFAEQVVADADDRDNHEEILVVVSSLPDQLTGVDSVRMLCALADLKVIAGADPYLAFEDIRERAYNDDGIRALIERRYARASAQTNSTDKAITAYRRAVMHSWHDERGGDVRAALRSIAGLAPRPIFPVLSSPIAVRAMQSARSVSDRRRLMSDLDSASVIALEHLCNDNTVDAIRWTHQWLRLEVVSGNEYDEHRARGQYATALERARRWDRAVRQRVVNGSRKAASATASKLDHFVEISSYLGSRSTQQRACAADVVARTADWIPDAEIDRIASVLGSVFVDSVDPDHPIDADDTIAALGAIAALGPRLPDEHAERVVPHAVLLVPREQGHYRFIDEQLIDFLIVCARTHNEHLAAPSIDALMELLRNDVGRTEQRVADRLADVPAVRARLVDLAENDESRSAAAVLASWNVPTEMAARHARDRAAELMKEPMNVPMSTHTVGSACTYTSEGLAAAAGSDSSPIATVVEEVIGPWLTHLDARVSDRHKSASERSDAVVGIRILIDHLDGQQRTELVHTALSLAEAPNLTWFDRRARAAQHDLTARSAFGADGLDFEAELVWTAAVAATSDEERVQILQHLRPLILRSEIHMVGSEALARAAIQLEASSLLPDLAGSRNTDCRKAAALLWAGSAVRDSMLGTFLATDSDRGVRATLAQALRSNDFHDAESREVLHRLQSDQSSAVRIAASPD